MNGENSKKQSKFDKNFIIYFCLGIILLLLIIKIDKVVEFFSENILSNTIFYNDVNGSSSDVTKNGYLLIDDSSCKISVDGITFYNFIKSGNNSFLVNINSNKDVSSNDLYIEIFNSNKELLFRENIKGNKIKSGSVVSYVVETDDYVYEKGYYALVKKYSMEEMNRDSNVTCKYNEANASYLLEYTIVYRFKNDLLKSYNVNKKIEVIANSTELDKAIKVLQDEYDTNDVFLIKSSFKNNVLNYDIDLTRLKNGYVPIYYKDVTPIIIKNKEIEKKWTCE